VKTLKENSYCSLLVSGLPPLVNVFNSTSALVAMEAVAEFEEEY